MTTGPLIFGITRLDPIVVSEKRFIPFRYRYLWPIYGDLIASGGRKGWYDRVCHDGRREK